MIYLIIFIICSLLGGSIHIGLSTLRVYSCILMILYLIVTKKKYCNEVINNKLVLIYIIFLLITFFVKIFSNAYNGNIIDEMSSFSKRLFSLYLVAIVGYYSISLIANTKQKVKTIIFVLSFISVFNAIISYLQYIDHPLGIGFALIFSSEDGAYMETYLSLTRSVQESQFVVPGIFGHGAINGYMNSSLGVFSLYFVFKDTRLLRVYGVISFVLSIIGAFAIQERSGFGLLLLFSFIIIFKCSRVKIRRIFVLLVIIIGAILIFFLNNYFEEDSVGRLSSMGVIGDDRQRLFVSAIDFIQDHWFLGGEELYSANGRVTPHNFFLHALIFSGVLGFVVISLLFGIMIYKSLKIILKKTNDPALFFSCSLCIYLLNGLFHSGSLITGDVLIWILCACMFNSQKLSKQEK